MQRFEMIRNETETKAEYKGFSHGSFLLIFYVTFRNANHEKNRQEPDISGQISTQ